MILSDGTDRNLCKKEIALGACYVATSTGKQKSYLDDVLIVPLDVAANPKLNAIS